MHEIVVTEGIVLGKRGAGEANTLLAILTKDRGLIRASARSARFERSKLRYGLELLTQARFALVRGRYEWKITGVSDPSRTHLSVHTAHRRAAGRVARLLLRLIHGEEGVSKLYEELMEGFVYLCGAAEEDVQHRECVLVLRLLARLGYVPTNAQTRIFLEATELSPELATAAREHRTALVRTINESLTATGL